MMFRSTVSIHNEVIGAVNTT